MLSKILSLILICLLMPIFILVGIVILFEDGSPIFFRQKRVGRNNEYFFIYKFRTMKKETPDLATHLLNNKQNLYTKIGPFLRRYSLDEIPQLLNIIKGDICFIGPRPALYNQKDLIKLRQEKGIHSFLPGVTGWAQVNGRDKVSIKEKVRLDNYYVKNKSFLLDIKIIFLTIKKVLVADGVLI